MKRKGGGDFRNQTDHKKKIKHPLPPLCSSSSPPPLSFSGTHDNDTTAGWYATAASPADKAALASYLGPSVDADPAWALLRAALATRARYALFPLQDVLRLPSSARMNFPGTAGDANWTWRAGEGVWQGAAREARELRALCALYRRLPPGAAEPNPGDAPAWPGGGRRRGVVGRVAGWVRRFFR